MAIPPPPTHTHTPAKKINDLTVYISKLLATIATNLTNIPAVQQKEPDDQTRRHQGWGHSEMMPPKLQEAYTASFLVIETAS